MMNSVTEPKRQLKLCGFITPSASEGWRLPDAERDLNAAWRFEPFRQIAQTLERGKFDAIFFNDAVCVTAGEIDPEMVAQTPASIRWDPLTLLSGLALVTSKLGLIATASTTYNEPYALARRFASLDWLSGGRAGWNLVTSLGGGENFNYDAHVKHAERYERAEEFIDVIRGLWDSWEDDAFVQDKESGTWVDPEKMHILNHKGKHFSVQGPLNAHRPCQGYPVITQAGSSGVGRELGARTGELIFTAAQTIDEARAFAKDIRDRAVKFGRDPQDIKIMPGVMVYVGHTEEEAMAKCDRISSLADPITTLRDLSAFISLGVDLSEYPLDGPVPLPEVMPDTNTHKSRQKLVYDLILREKPTIRQLLRKLAAAGHQVLIGTPQTIADVFQEWFESGAVDGFNIMFGDMSSTIDDFVEMVVPELQRRGIFRLDYEGNTLREHLGFNRPENSFVLAREQQAA